MKPNKEVETKYGKLKKRMTAIAAASVCLLAAAALSQPGKRALREALATVSALGAQQQDVERRARARHGWDRQAIANTEVRGTLRYFNGDGTEAQRFGVKLTRKYPNQMRLELDLGGPPVIVAGFGQGRAWRAGAASVAGGEGRSLRDLLRMWPERLFTSRANGAAYREIGRRVEHDTRERPAPGEPERPLTIDEVEIEDQIIVANQGRPERRRINYLINSMSGQIMQARWMEPILAPGIEQEDTPQVAVRVDYFGWQEVEGVLWPMEVVRWRGGRIDLRLEISEVRFNQQLADAIFQNP